VKIRKVKNIYADNNVIYPVVKKYSEMYKAALDAGLDPPRIPEDLGKVIWDIANGLASRPNFGGYTYKDEMIMDGVMDCMKYIHKFDAIKYDKPYSYINKIIWQAFLRRIDKEKKQQYIKYKLTMSNIYGNNIYIDHNDEIYEKIKDLEEKYEKKKGLEAFVEDTIIIEEKE